MKRGLVKVAAVILAAGKGTRMRSDRPKVLNEICGKPLLHYTLKTLNSLAGSIKGLGKLEGVYVVVGHQADRVRNAFKDENIHWVNQKKQRGTGDALAVTEPLLRDFEGIILVLCGDSPLLRAATLKELIQTHISSAKSAATILTCHTDGPAGYGRIIRNKKGAVKGIVEESDANIKQRGIREISSGTFAFGNEVFKILKKVKPHSQSGEINLTDVIEIWTKEGENIVAFVGNASECMGVNTHTDLSNAQQLIRQRLINELIDNGVVVVAPENTYIEDGVTIGRNSVIYPFTVIHSGVTIGQDCHIGPFSHLRSGTVLEDGAEIGNFTETKKTRLGRNSKAKHLSYLGDALIGANVNIGAGTITANYDGVRKERTIIEDGASTGSGTILIAPLKMGRNAKTGAGAVVTKGKDIPEGATVTGVPARDIKNKGN